jgi:hypothetical protein
MRRNLYATLALAAALAPGAPALNPVHDASYSLVPRGKHASTAVASVAGAVDSRADDRWAVPLSLSLEAGRRAELGAGLKTQWGSAAGDHVPYLVFGAKYLLTGATTLHGDLLLGAVRGAGKGFFLGLHHREGHGSRLFSRSLEAAWYPTLAIVRPLSLEMGLVASSQTTSFNDYFALDLKPALQVHIGRESVVESAVYVGLAGERREDLRAQVTVIYGF